MVDFFLQQRADLGARLSQIGVLIDYNDQTVLARHGGKRIECLVKRSERQGRCPRLAGKYRLAEVLQIRLRIGATSLKVNGALSLNELRDKARLAHAAAAVNHGHLKGI